MQFGTEKNKRKETVKRFKKTIRAFSKTNTRAFPWRELNRNPYHVLVSEVMLQQTQTARVIEKFRNFLKVFPTVAALAGASDKAVLGMWSGLGYNRRALFLKRAAHQIITLYEGVVPTKIETLKTLPGIGPYTAVAIAAFAYNQPCIFIETNIRTVFIHHFFPKARTKISDDVLLPFIAETLDTKNPRAWYEALMDYGAYLKQQGNTLHRKSKSYAKQSTFKGSVREVRGSILRQLITNAQTRIQLAKTTRFSNERIEAALASLVKEKMIQKKGNQYFIP